MTTQPTAELTTDPTGLTLHVEHTAPLLDLPVLDIWQVQIRAEGLPVGSVRAVRGLYGDGTQDREEMWGEGCSVMGGIPSIDLAAAAEQDLFPEEDTQLAELRSRFAARGGICALVAEQMLTDEAVGLREWGSRNVLVFDQFSLSAPWNDPVTAACVISSVADQAASGDFLLVFPARTVTGGGDTALLEAGGSMLWAEPWYTDDLYYLDTKFDQGEGAAEAWELLHSRVRR
ncbi:hypothetical protein [Streptomyces parvus]|uniref:hypothetical protein n=1 Tax=Streptomyces parvus TaxID=66428 RepID=UPI002100C5DB|nr:hypothetical protein [Streptomyces parvus]MCQ1577200.1 hypothetical protein [Streptomyces parvus]